MPPIDSMSPNVINNSIWSDFTSQTLDACVRLLSPAKSWVLLGLLSLFSPNLGFANPLAAIKAARSCELAVTSGIKLPNTKLDSDKLPYFEFASIEEAEAFLEDGFAATRNDPAERALHLLPAMNGLREIYRRTNTRILTNHNKSEIRKLIVMWFNTLEQLRNSVTPSDDKFVQDLYQVAVRLTGSDLFQPLDHPVAFGNFAVIFRKLNRPPPENLLKKWLDGFQKVNRENNSHKLQANFVELLPLLNLSHSEMSRLTRIWLAAEDTLDSIPIDLLEKGRVLNSLYLVDPAAAYSYFVRYKSEFLTLDLHRPQYIVRALAYFKYVLRKSVPVFDTEYLKKHFSDYESKITGIERQVKNILASFGVKFEQNTYDSSAPFIEFDFLLKLSDDRKLNIEVDGPHHFFKDSNGTLIPRLADRRRDEILKALGIEVYRIPYFDLSDPAAVENRLLQVLIEGRE